MAQANYGVFDPEINFMIPDDINHLIQGYQTKGIQRPITCWERVAQK